MLHHQPRCCQVPDRGQAHGVPRPGPGQAPHLRIELATEFRDSFHNIRMRPRCNFREIFTCVHCMVSGENCSTESETVPFMQTSILLPSRFLALPSLFTHFSHPPKFRYFFKVKKTYILLIRCKSTIAQKYSISDLLKMVKINLKKYTK